MIQLDDIQVEYDNYGRIKYNPQIHDKQGMIWTEEDKEYLCKYHTSDDLETMAFALGRTKTTIAALLTNLKKDGRYEYYRHLNKYW